MRGRAQVEATAGRSPIRELLLAVAAHNPDSSSIGTLVRGVDATAFADAATEHRVASLAHERLTVVDGVPSGHLDALAAARFQAQARRIMLLRTLAIASRALDVPVLTMKGHALAANWYADPNTRDFNDLDILVRPRDFGRALNSLAMVGMEPATTNWHGFRRHEVGEVPVHHRGSIVDLHWHVIATGPERRHLHLETAEFFERAVPTRLGELEVLTLCPVDTLLHLCVNTGLGGARRLRGLIDIDTVGRSGQVDMVEFATRAWAAGAGRMCAAILQRSNLLLGTPVDPDMLTDLAAGPSWLRANQIVDRISVSRRSSADVGRGLLISSGRRSRLQTVAAFVGGARRGLLTRVGRADLTDAGGPLDWTRYPRDGQVESHRRTYLRWVACMPEPDPGPHPAPIPSTTPIPPSTPIPRTMVVQRG